MSGISLYETVKTFELRTDLQTKVVAEVSARDHGGRRSYRVAVFRVYEHDGSERRSPWLGVRELVLKAGLEKAAIEYIRGEETKARCGSVAKLEPLTDGDEAHQ